MKQLKKFIDNYKTSIEISAVHWSPAPTKICAQSVDLAYLGFRRSAFIPPTKPLKTTPTAFLLWRWRWNSAKLFSRKMIILTASEWKKNLVSPCYAFLDRPSSATTTTAAKPSPLTRIFTFRVFKYLKYYDTGRINCYYYFLDVIN